MLIIRAYRTAFSRRRIMMIQSFIAMGCLASLMCIFLITSATLDCLGSPVGIPFQKKIKPTPSAVSCQWSEDFTSLNAATTSECELNDFLIDFSSVWSRIVQTLHLSSMMFCRCFCCRLAFLFLFVYLVLLWATQERQGQPGRIGQVGT